ncbi:cytochrome P450 [Truncatella angustata]|uniref:Cytochrome P450 n=1 Tax=Truncatella angustata TaxID=152316 RepID=A0A9P8UFN5_9PEZI|nr:cytochrome P450 [Truncatella angustata]KAH6649111.1 cytochrome P450 [Truncatella angustata]
MLTALISTSALAVVAWLIIRHTAKLTRKSSLNIPYLSFPDGDNSPQRYTLDTGNLLAQGYEQYSKKGLPFSMFNYTDAARPIVVLPVKYLEEVRRASSSKLSFLSYLNKDWTPFNGFALLLPLISRVMARVLLGPELWDNEEWHAVVTAYFQAGFAASARVRDTYHPLLRWTSRYLDKDVKAIYEARRKGEAIIKPVIEARIANTRNRAGGQETGYNDGVQWLVDSYLSENKRVSAGRIMQDEAFLVAASVHSIALTTLSILLDLVDHPKTLAEVRDEISKVYAEYGSWTRQSLSALRLLDSFMKESQRLNNFQYNTMQRRAIVDYTFKDGLRIPAGTSIVVPSRLLGRDSDLHDNALQFEANRWKRMREEGDATKFHFASLQDDMLPWGSGSHACPGRFLAQEIIKLIFIHLVTKYDIKFPEGVESRPPDLAENANSNPNVMATFLFKER